MAASDEYKDMERQKAMYQDEDTGWPLQSDVQLGEKLINVESKISRRIIKVPMRDKQGNLILDEHDKPILVPYEVPTDYKETLTGDTATAFLEPNNDLSVFRSCCQLIAQIKSFGESNDADMSESQGVVADYANTLLVSSKATGEGAKIAKSQIVTQKGVSHKYISEEKRKGGKFLGVLPI